MNIRRAGCVGAGLLLAITVGGSLPGMGATTVSVATWHNDNQRDGQNPHETILTTSNVNSATFGKLFSYKVDGPIYAQPLYLPSVSIHGKGKHNVVFVATENDSVYAFDADGLTKTALWQESLLVDRETAVPCRARDICNVMSPLVGITGTPVIDTVTGTLYVVALILNTDGTYSDRLHAIDITSGEDKFGGPVTIAASVQGSGEGSVNGVVTFDAAQQLQRPGLLLDPYNGVVYIAWGSFGDHDPYHGWVMGYNKTTLAQVAVFNTSPNGTRAAVWQSGGALAMDSTTQSIWLQTANGTFDASTGGSDYGDSFLRLSTSNGLSVVDYFTPDNQATLETNDIDLGSCAGLILPVQASTYPDEILSAGKEGLIYMVDRDNMGGYSDTQNANVETVTGSVDGYREGPAYWNSAVYMHGRNDYLSRYTLSRGLLSDTPVSQSPTTFAQGSTPSISSNGNMNGIVWAIDPGSQTVATHAVLHAYNALNLSEELYNSTQAGTRDTAADGVKFSVPTVVNGKVYIGTQSEVDVYGLLSTAF